MEIVFVAPQASIPGPLLCNIFVADLFFIVNSTDTAKCADSNTLFATANDVDILIASLEEASKCLFT